MYLNLDSMWVLLKRLVNWSVADRMIADFLIRQGAKFLGFLRNPPEELEGSAKVAAVAAATKKREGTGGTV